MTEEVRREENMLKGEVRKMRRRKCVWEEVRNRRVRKCVEEVWK